MKLVDVWVWILGIQGWEATTGGLKAETLNCPDASAARWLLKSLSRGDLLVKWPRCRAVGTDSGFGTGKCGVKLLAAG